MKPKTLPEAGTDVVFITIEETYDIEGVGNDKVVLKGILVSERAVPLLGHGEKKQSWDKSTVVAKFSKLELLGASDLFGEVRVTLDNSTSSFGVVTAGKCAAALSVNVNLPDLGLLLRSAEPIQLKSTVTTVPPIGDEKTESVNVVHLIDVKSGLTRGEITHARVAWRELDLQSVDDIKLTL